MELRKEYHQEKYNSTLNNQYNSNASLSIGQQPMVLTKTERKLDERPLRVHEISVSESKTFFPASGGRLGQLSTAISARGL